MRFKVIALSLVALFATSVMARAQILSGTVSGVVKDDQGGVLPGVLVTVRAPMPRKSTRQNRTATSVS